MQPLHCPRAWPWDQVFILIPESCQWIQGSQAGRACTWPIILLVPCGLAVAVVIAVIVFNLGWCECCWRRHWYFMLVHGSLELRLYQFLLAQSPIYNFLRLKRVHPRALIFCPFLTQFYQSTSKCVEFVETLLSFKVMEHLSNDSSKLWECRPC